jgi:hypothetical protein
VTTNLSGHLERLTSITGAEVIFSLPSPKRGNRPSFVNAVFSSY